MAENEQVASVYVINLDRRPDRLAFMAEQLSTLGLKWHRIAAIDGAKSLAAHHDVIFTKHWRRLALRPSEKAIVLGHRQAWQAFLASTSTEAVILEDDVNIEPGLATLAKQGAGVGTLSMPVKVEYFPFSQRRDVWIGKRRAAPDAQSTQIRRLHSTYLGSAGYLLSRKAADVLLKRTLRVNRPIDWLLFDPMPFDAKSAAAILVPHLVMQSLTQGQSDIFRMDCARPSFWQQKLRRYTWIYQRVFAQLIYRAKRYRLEYLQRMDDARPDNDQS